MPDVKMTPLQLQYGVPSTYPSPLDKAYTRWLVVLLIYLVAATVYGAKLTRDPECPRVTAFALLIIHASYTGASAIVLYVRIKFESKRKWPTVAFNVILLFLFPVGTILGIYGLFNIDRRRA